MKEVYTLKPVIKKTGNTHAYNVYTCIDFKLFKGYDAVADDIDCFTGLPVGSRAKSKQAFANINLSGSLNIATEIMENFAHTYIGVNREIKTICKGNKFIFTVR